jgi:hypothetical protein
MKNNIKAHELRIHKGEGMIGWYHKEPHSFILFDPLNFKKI